MVLCMTVTHTAIIGLKKAKPHMQELVGEEKKQKKKCECELMFCIHTSYANARAPRRLLLLSTAAAKRVRRY